MKKVDVLLGLQCGDEGKGKIVDFLTPNYELVARFQGGPNAGHTIEFNGNKHVLHTIPSGVFQVGAKNIIGNGVIIDPVILCKEIESCDGFAENLPSRLMISKKAHLILPSHRILDAASEAAKGKSKIGSTLKGIGPTYMDQIGRNGLRVGEILKPNFKDRYTYLKNKHIELLSLYNFEYNIDAYEEEWFQSIEKLKEFNLIDGENYIYDALVDNKNVLAEGAQGTMLDISLGTYPFVTSSNTISAGACTGLGIAPSQIGEVFGIFKAYCTRVGSGPFPTEDFGDDGKKLQELGDEYGSTTGRSRRCGWLDLVALKYAIRINGVTQLYMMKTDVLDTFDEIKICTSYKTETQEVNYIPYELEDVKPVYKIFKGWKADTSASLDYDNLPSLLKEYISFIETETRVPVKIVSVGPGRKQTIIRE